MDVGHSSVKFQETGLQIVGFINDPIQKAWRLINPGQGTRFVVCGTSGSGITRAIDLANGILHADEQIAESRDLALEKNLQNATEILEDANLRYEDSPHIAFTVYGIYLAKALELKGVKVFWLDSGYSDNRWQIELSTSEA